MVLVLVNHNIPATWLVYTQGNNALIFCVTLLYFSWFVLQFIFSGPKVIPDFTLNDKMSFYWIGSVFFLRTTPVEMFNICFYFILFYKFNSVNNISHNVPSIWNMKRNYVLFRYRLITTHNSFISVNHSTHLSVFLRLTNGVRRGAGSVRGRSLCRWPREAQLHERSHRTCTRVFRPRFPPPASAAHGTPPRGGEREDCGAAEVRRRARPGKDARVRFDAGGPSAL